MVHGNSRPERMCDSARSEVTNRLNPPEVLRPQIGKIAPKPLVYIVQESYWMAIHLYLVKQFKIESSDIFKFSYISKISMCTLSIGTSPFEILQLCFRTSHYLKNC